MSHGSRRIGVIADDLTGAAEIGGIGRRYGLTAEILVGGKITESKADLVCIDSDSRSSTPTDAASLVARSARTLKQLNPAWIYKKVDSVLRGNVLVEIEAIIGELGFSRALLAPANPSFGRIIRDGIYYIKGQPIAETDFARDPEYPRRSSDVRKLLSDDQRERLLVIKPIEALPDSGVALGEVSSLMDVRHWAQLQSADTLCAGGAEFFTALLERSGRPMLGISPTPSREASSQTVPQTAPRELFICGSICETAQRFVTASQAKGIPVFYLPHQIVSADKAAVLETIAKEAGKTMDSYSRVVLSVQPPIVTDRERARQFAINLVRIARNILAQRPNIRVCIEGGATAAALVYEMGWQQLEVVDELAPGVVTLRPRQSSTTLTMKPGSYSGWET